MSAPGDEFQPSDNTAAERAAGADTAQDDYVSRTGQKDHIPVQSDKAAVETSGYDNPAQADSDEQLSMLPLTKFELRVKVKLT